MTASRHGRFHLRSLDQLRAAVEERGLRVPIDEDLSVLGEPVTLADRTAPNRFVAQPMEGYDAGPDGGPGPLTFRRYLRYARGRFGLIWVALLILTAVTVAVSRVDVGALNIWVALGVASIKSSLVIFYFMHLRQESLLFKVGLLVMLAILAIFVGMTFFDVLYR